MKQRLVLCLVSLLLVSCTSTQPSPGIILVQTATGLERLEGGKSTQLPLPDGVTDLEPSPDGTYLTGKQDGQWVYFKVGQKRTRTLSQAWTPVTSWAPQSNTLAIAEGGNLRVLDLETGREKGFSITESTSIYHLSWSPSGTDLAISIGEWNQQGELVILDLASGNMKSLGRVPFHPVPRWSPDGNILAFHRTEREHEREVVIYHIGRGDEQPLLSRSRLYELVSDEAHHLNEHNFSLGSIDFAPDAEWLYFNYKAAGRDPRFVVGAIRTDGQEAHTWVLPLHADKAPSNISPPRPCQPASQLTWTDQGPYLRLDGPGCIDQLVRLSWPDLTVTETFAMPNPAQPERLFIAPDGALALSHGWTTEFVVLDGKGTAPSVQINGTPLGWFASKK